MVWYIVNQDVWWGGRREQKHLFGISKEKGLSYNLVNSGGGGGKGRVVEREKKSKRVREK